MSYNLTVTAQDGQLTVAGSGDIPDGKYIVNGHSDANGVNLGVSRYHTDGRTLAQATSYTVRSDA